MRTIRYLAPSLVLTLAACSAADPTGPAALPDAASMSSRAAEPAAETPRTAPADGPVTVTEQGGIMIGSGS